MHIYQVTGSAIYQKPDEIDKSIIVDILQMAIIQFFISISWIFIGLNEFLEPSSCPLYLVTFMILNIVGFSYYIWHILACLWAYFGKSMTNRKTETTHFINFL